MIRMCVGACAFESRNATRRSDSRTMSAGISRAAILQKTQELSVFTYGEPPFVRSWTILRPAQLARRDTVAARGAFPQLGEPLEQRALLLREVARGDDVQGHEEVTSPPPLQMWHSLPSQTEDRARLRPGFDPEPLRPVEGLDLDLSAERGLGDRDVEHAVQVLALPDEGLRRLDLDADDQVPRGTAGHARVALSAHAEVHALEDARGDIERHGGRRAHASLAAALVAPVRDLLARPPAGHARRGRHHRAEDA